MYAPAPRGTATAHDVVSVPLIRGDLQIAWPQAALTGGDAADAAGPSTSTSNRAPPAQRSRQLLVHNHAHVAQGQATAEVVCAVDGVVQWRTLVEDVVTAVAAGTHHAALALHDKQHHAGSLQVLNARGATVLGPFMTDYPVAMLATQGLHVAALLTNGRLQAWHVPSGEVCSDATQSIRTQFVRLARRNTALQLRVAKHAPSMLPRVSRLLNAANSQRAIGVWHNAIHVIRISNCRSACQWRGMVPSDAWTSRPHL